MPTIKETRRANFRALLARYEKQVEFAELCNLSPGHVSQMANGHRNIGDTVARRIERNLSLPDGWMDQRRHEEQSAETLEDGPPVGTLRRAPLVGTAQLGMDGYWLELGYPAGHGDGWLEVPTRDPNAYSLRVRGDSMAPAIPNGWIVLVEPNHDLIPSEYVLVKLKDGRTTVKTYLYTRGDLIGVKSVNKEEMHEFWADEVEDVQYVGGVFPPSKLKLG